MMNYGNMSKKLILEIFDISSIPNTTGLSGETFIMLFYSRIQIFFFEKGGEKGPQKWF